MKTRTEIGSSSRTTSQREGGHHPKPRVNISSQKLGFFRWRTSLPTARSSHGALHGRSKLKPDAGRNSDERQRVVESIPKPTNFLRLSSVDPFVPFAGHEDTYLVQEVLDHARNSFWKTLAPTRRPDELVPPTFEFYGHMKMSSLLYWAYLIPTSTALDYQVRHHPDQVKHAQLRLRTTNNLLQAIREGLRSYTDESLDAMIAAVLVLAACPQIAVQSRHTYIPPRFNTPLAQAQCVDMFSIQEFPRTHSNGLKVLVDVRGGLDKMASPDLAALVQLGDLIDASRNSTMPMFAFHSFFGDPKEDRHYSAHAQTMLTRLQTGFSNVMPLLPNTKNLKDAVNAAVEATVALDHYRRTGSSPSVFADLIDLRNQAQHLALSVPRMSGASATIHGQKTSNLTEALVQENVRLTLLLYNNLVLYPLHPVCGLADRLVGQLKLTLESTQRLCPGLWTLNPKLLLWMLLLGGISIEGGGLRDEKAWFHMELEKLMLKMFGSKASFQDIEPCLGEFLWLGWILNEESERFCSETVFPSTTQVK